MSTLMLLLLVLLVLLLQGSKWDALRLLQCGLQTVEEPHNKGLL